MIIGKRYNPPRALGCIASHCALTRLPRAGGMARAVLMQSPR